MQHFIIMSINTERKDIPPKILGIAHSKDAADSMLKVIRLQPAYQSITEHLFISEVPQLKLHFWNKHRVQQRVLKEQTQTKLINLLLDPDNSEDCSGLLSEEGEELLSTLDLLKNPFFWKVFKEQIEASPGIITEACPPAVKLLLINEIMGLKDLKICPFCGGEKFHFVQEKFDDSFWGDRSNAKIAFKCKTCNVTIKDFSIREKDDYWLTTKEQLAIEEQAEDPDLTLNEIIKGNW
jgi:hypothetical protein